MKLAPYNHKRNFKQTLEPRGKIEAGGEHRFVVQRHDASHLHYDFRLEMDGVLKSWAIPKGPSLDPSQKRLAVQVEDHPLSYIHFQGTIPAGNYGAGTVEIWDMGNYTPLGTHYEPVSEKEALHQLKKGELKFLLEGKKLKGIFVLVQLKNDAKNWLLIRHRDRPVSGKRINSKKPGPPGRSIKKKKTPDNKKSAMQKISSAKDHQSVKAGRYRVSLSHYDKIFWPKEGYTKGDVIAYYEQVSSWLLPHLKNRPLSLKRNPNGIRDAGFFHKNAGENAPDFVTVFPFHSESSKRMVEYVMCNNLASLLYIANLGCIELDPWNSTSKKAEHPTWMVIDIDPSPKNTFRQVVEVARAAKTVLESAALSCYCKTSGATGLHVYVPLKNKYPYAEVREAAKLVAKRIQEMLPRLTTMERSLSKRGPHIYIDYLQNSQGQTLASAYSIRPVPGATVSAPLEWKEVNEKLHPTQFTIQNMISRLKKKGDLFKGVLTGTAHLKKAVRLLESGSPDF